MASASELHTEVAAQTQTCSKQTSDQQEQCSSGFKLHVLSWNIDGLDSRDLRERTIAVIDTIKHRSPHVVFLQEVVPQTFRMLRAQLGSFYSVHISPNLKYTSPQSKCPQYFPAILVTKAFPEKISVVGEVEVVDFFNSCMGRHLVQLLIQVCGISIALYTTHLESMKDYSRERTEQLRICFKLIVKQKEVFQHACIFGGDLNIRNWELAKYADIPESTIDIWEACGSAKEHEFTWDITTNDNLDWPFPNKPQLRFDRLYLTDNGNKVVHPVSFELVGKDRVPSCHNRFPSDHWGMYTVIDVTEVVQGQ